MYCVICFEAWRILLYEERASETKGMHHYEYVYVSTRRKAVYTSGVSTSDVFMFGAHVPTMFKEFAPLKFFFFFAGL